jgi:hypothetical protein
MTISWLILLSQLLGPIYLKFRARALTVVIVVVVVVVVIATSVQQPLSIIESLPI